MKALYYLGPEKLEIKQTEKPVGEVVIEVIGTGICGTDLKTYLKGHPMFKPPTILGHECYGKIVELSDCPGELKLGDTVAIAPYVECGECDVCKRGTPELCKNKSYVESGCFAEYVAMSKEHARKALFKVTDDPVQSLAEPLACVYNGFEKLIHKPKKLLIVGGGPMGTLFALLGLSQGCDTYVVEKSNWRLEYLRKMGITSGSEPPQGVFDGVILAVNIPELVKEYIPLAADGGKVLLFSGYPKDAVVELDPYAIHYREVGIVGSFGFALEHFKRAVRTLCEMPELFSKLITHTFELEKAPEAFELLRRGKAMKILLRM